MDILYSMQPFCSLGKYNKSGITLLLSHPSYGTSSLPKEGSPSSQSLRRYALTTIYTANLIHTHEHQNMETERQPPEGQVRRRLGALTPGRLCLSLASPGKV